MKEVMNLIRELRGYPENSFAFIHEGRPEYGEKEGVSLRICDIKGEVQGVIELGGKGEVTTK